MAPENGRRFGITFPRDLRAATLSPAAATVAARAGLAAPTVPCGCEAMFGLPRCSAPCRAVPFQLDPHGSANLGNPTSPRESGRPDSNGGCPENGKELEEKVTAAVRLPVLKLLGLM
ncbi:unnamed protein product [Coccothraustes coccothraustes]